jgi:hypothetical protein
LMVAEVRRRFYEDLYYGKNFVLYYPAKTFGQYCSCYDAVRGKWSADCLACYGTRYVGGFFNPIVLPHKETPKQEGDEEGVRVKGRNLRAFFPGIFPLHKGDVFIDSDNDRFIVASVDIERFEGALVKQAVTASPIPNDEVKQQLPVDLTLLAVPDRLMVERVS